jgi:TolB-like protein
MFTPKDSLFISKKHIFLLLFIICLLLPPGCQTSSKTIYREKNGRIYGKIKHFKHRWYHYYKRGISFVQGDFYQEAISDFQTAIQKRDNDQRRARTYGMHVIDYFPHRELGIIYYKQNNIIDAIKELEASLLTEKSAKAEYYLDLARQTMIETKHLDHKPPEIKVTTPTPSFSTNKLQTTICGLVRDDTFVKDIRVGSIPIRMDLSQKEMSFRKKVKLKPGPNHIVIQSSDLTGKSSQITCKIFVDEIGPLISIHSFEAVHTEKGKFQIRANISDNTGIKKIYINDRQIPCNGSQYQKINERFFNENKTVIIKAVDKVGNITTAHVKEAIKTNVLIRNNLLAGDFISDNGKFLYATNEDTRPPKINFNFPKETKITFLDYMYLEGSIQDDWMINNLFINGKEVLNETGKEVFFNLLIPLKKGKNVITVTGMDAAGHIANKTLKVIRKIPDALMPDKRLKIAITKFKYNPLEGSQQLNINFEKHLYMEIKKKKRFSVIHPDKINLKMKKLAGDQNDLIDEEAAILAAKKLKADFIMIGSIKEDCNGITIYARLVDTEFPEEFEDIAIDIFTKKINRSKIRTLSQGLNFKLADEFPLVTGQVLNVLGNNKIVKIDIGKTEQIKKGMKVFVYYIEKLIDKDTFEVIWEESKTISLARIKNVKENESIALLAKSIDTYSSKLEKNVVTK